MTRPGGRLAALLAGGLVLIALGLLVARTIAPGHGQMTYGYPSYHLAARLMLDGEWGPQAYDNDWYADRVRTMLGLPIGEIVTPNLPTVALLALPLAGFDPQTARDIWIWANLPLLIGAVALTVPAARRLAPPGGEPGATNRAADTAIWLGFAAVAILLPATRANFRIGQAYIIVWLLCAGAFRALDRADDRRAGILLGLVVMLKSTGLAIWLFFVLRRRWHGLAAGLLTCGIVFALTLPWLGMEAWLAYPAALRRSTTAPIVAVTAYQNTPSLLNHLLRRDAAWNPAPVADAPWAASGLFLAIAGGSVGLTLLRGYRAGAAGDSLLVATLLLLSIVLLPLAEEHQFVLLMPGLAAWLHDWLARGPLAAARGWRRAGEWLLPVLALALLLLPSYYKDPALADGWRALAAYPRVYGGWLLWLALLLRLRPAAEPGSAPDHPQRV